MLRFKMAGNGLAVSAPPDNKYHDLARETALPPWNALRQRRSADSIMGLAV